MGKDIRMKRDKVWSFNIINGVKDLKYRWSAHKSKHNRWYEADITPYRHFVFCLGGYLKNYPKWRVGLKISSVNILILNQEVPINNIIPLPESP